MHLYHTDFSLNLQKLQEQNSIFKLKGNLDEEEVPMHG